MNLPNHTTLVARLDSTWCLARIGIGTDRRLRITLDAGYRPSTPGPNFARYVRRTWKPVPAGLPGVEQPNPPHRDGDSEIPGWRWRLRSPADLGSVRLFVQAQWRGLSLEPQSWPIDQFSGDRFFAFATGFREILVAQDWRLGADGRWQSQLDSYIAAIGNGWSRLAHDDCRACGEVRFADCVLSEGPVPDPYAQFLSSLGADTDSPNAEVR